MIEIVNSPNGTLTYTVPHVFHTIEDASAVAGVTTSPTTGTLFTPIYTEKGPTNVVKYFTARQAAEMINTFGQPNVRKLGLAYTAAYNHIMDGGNVAVISVKHESATNAGFIVNLVIESKDADGNNIEKTLGWILPDGSGFVEDPYADDNKPDDKPTPQHVAHKVRSRKISFETVEVSDINSTDELELLVQAQYDDEAGKISPGDKRVFPLIWGLYKGKGNYGNNFQVLFTPLERTVKGRPYFEANIYDKRSAEYIPNMKQPVSLNMDRIDTEPLFISRRYQLPYSTGDFYMNTLDNNEMNFIGELIQKELGKITLFPGGATTAGTVAEALEARVEDLKALFDIPEDEDFHRLSYFDPTNLGDLGEVFVSERLRSANFSGGSEGLLADVARKGFDWNMVFNTADPGQPKKEEKLLQDMFSNAFMGGASNDVFNLLTNPCDYIIDIGYPLEVKKSMINFATNRDEVEVLFNAPITSNSVSEAIAWKQGFNNQGRNIYYYPGSFNYIDTRTDKTIRCPQTFFVMHNVLDHYKNGYQDPIAGLDHGVLSGYEVGSARGFGDMSLAQNDRLYKAGFNIVSSHAEGLLYLDSQRSNYKLTEVSSLQEFHNNSIINRILKQLYLSLQYEKHRLNSAEAVAKIVSKIENILKGEFGGKVRSLNYSGFFESTWAENVGLMQHKIEIQFFNTVKYHQIYIKALPSA